MDIVDILMDGEQGNLGVSGRSLHNSSTSKKGLGEDSASQDEGGTIDNLTDWQLRAGAEIALTNGQRITDEEELKAAANPSTILNQPNQLVNQDQWTDEDLHTHDFLFPKFSG